MRTWRARLAVILDGGDVDRGTARCPDMATPSLSATLWRGARGSTARCRFGQHGDLLARIQENCSSEEPNGNPNSCVNQHLDVVQMLEAIEAHIVLMWSSYARFKGTVEYLARHKIGLHRLNKNDP